MKKKRIRFYPKQLENWKRVERVRTNTRWDMHSREARIVSGLKEEQYLFVLNNYEALEKAVAKQKTKKGQKV